jgi:hypothetical protein
MLAALIGLISAPTVAVDNAIRVLGVYPSGAVMDANLMKTKLESTIQAWNETGLPSSSVGNVTIDLLYGGTAQPISLPSIPTDMLAIPPWATQQSSVINLRNSTFADIVILFVPGNSPTAPCGTAPNPWVGGNKLPGVDLRFKENAFVAAVTLATVCGISTAAHELGHLLGGDHFSSAAQGLYSSSHAFIRNYFNPNGVLIQVGTAIAQLTEFDTCFSPWDDTRCIRLLRYSSTDALYGDSGHNNKLALSETAQSVANYRQTPTLVFYPPVFVTGALAEICVNGGWTIHDVWWTDDSRNSIPASTYNIWYSQPPGQPYTFGWSVPNQIESVAVYGANSIIRVQAISSFPPAVSSLSPMSYTANYVTGGWGCQ